jgi:hypothetical protein
MKSSFLAIHPVFRQLIMVLEIQRTVLYQLSINHHLHQNLCSENTPHHGATDAIGLSATTVSFL